MAKELLELFDEYDMACNEVSEFFDGLDAIEILRTYTPSHKRWLLDRLENALRLRDKIMQEIGNAGDVENE